ncbi:MAG: BON domain-containing protein [Armatimonadetes bacterium]|nr:BON domain-containing protein [Armatimonadota bacterium]
MKIGSEALAALVRDRLLADYRVASQPIDVRCSDGCVSLVGFVDTPEQKELVVRLVSGLIGVRSVTDGIEVRTISLSRTQATDDTWIRT